MGSRGTPAIDALRAAGVWFTEHEYRHLAAGSTRDRRPGYGEEAAIALGVDARRVLKSLVTDVDGRLVTAIVPVSLELDLKRLAGAVGGRRATLADPRAAERATGYVTGGISPLGQRRSMPTVIDESAMAWPTVFVSGGRRGLDVEVAPADLVAISAAIIASIARHR